MRFRSLIAALVTLVVTSCVLLAQTSKGILSGIVRDTTGAAIPAATVTVKNEDTGETRTVKSEANGAYRIDAISPGNYTLHTEITGFQKFDVKDVAVHPSVVTSFDPTLQVGSLEESVEVTADSALLNTENGSLSGTIGAVELQKIPIFSLNPIELATTVPGVQIVRNSDMSNGESVQVSGARPRANNFLVDGQEINDVSIGGQALQPQMPFMFQDTVVYTHNPPAEFGRASGGVVNLITKSGTNHFHGTVWELYTGSGLNALDGQNRGDFYSGTKTRFNQHQFGFVVGGPIIKDKLFAFGGAQWTRFYGKEETASFAYPDANGIALLKQIAGGSGTTATQAQKLLGYLNNGAYLTTYGPGAGGGSTSKLGAACPTLQTNCSITTAGFKRPKPNSLNPDTQWNYRVDYNPRSSDSLFFRYVHDRQSLTPDLFANPTADIGFDTYQGGPGEVGQGGWTHVFTPNLLNEFRVAETRINFQFAPTDEAKANPLFTAPRLSFGNSFVNNASVGPSMSSVGFAASSFPQGRIEELYQFQDTLSYTFRRHTVRFGGDIGRQLNIMIVPQNTPGSVGFAAGGSGVSQIGNFLLDQTGPSGSVARSFGPQRADPHVWRIGGFVQDDVKVTPELTLNIGARYDYFSPLENALPYPAIDPNNLYGPIATRYTVKADKNNFAPRVGFSYQPQNSFFSDRKTVIRGSYGVFFDSDFTNLAFNNASAAPNSFSNTLQVSTGNGVANATTGAIASITPVLSEKGSVTSVVNNLVNPYTYEYNLGVERQLPFQLVATATYVGSRSVKLFANQQFNYINPATAQRLNPSRGVINARGNFGSANYNGLETALERKFTHGLFVRGTYTYSKALDNASEVFALDSELTSYSAADLSLRGHSQEWGNSGYDHRHFASIVYVWSPAGFHANGGFADTMAGIFTRGWTISGVEQFQTGTYSSFFIGGLDVNGDGNANNDRPIIGNAKLPFDKIGIDGAWVQGGTPGLYYDLAANNATGALNPVNLSDVHFAVQSGNQFLKQEIGRNSYANPGAQFHNIALEKAFRLPGRFGENSRLTLRSEVKNLPNHNNIGVLDTNVLGVGDSYLYRLNGREAYGRQVKLWAKFDF
jgi:hypothetical protein